MIDHCNEKFVFFSRIVSEGKLRQIPQISQMWLHSTHTEIRLSRQFLLHGDCQSNRGHTAPYSTGSPTGNYSVGFVWNYWRSHSPFGDLHFNVTLGIHIILCLLGAHFHTDGQ